MNVEESELILHCLKRIDKFVKHECRLQFHQLIDAMWKEITFINNKEEK